MRDELDHILDETVKSYAAIEPPPALPARILRQAQLEPAPQRNRRWRLALAIALPLAATLALVFLFATRLTPPKPPTPIASQPPTPSIAAPTPPQPPETLAAATRESAVPVRRHAHPAQSARSWARPLSAPYSKEELALLNFVQQHPKQAAEIAEAQKQQAAAALQPIAISPIQIKPLTIAALN